MWGRSRTVRAGGLARLLGLAGRPPRRPRRHRDPIPHAPRAHCSPPTFGNGFAPSVIASQSRSAWLRSATRSESGRRTAASRPSRQRGLRLGPWARGGRGRGAMRAVRRLVSSPPLPGPPRARAASRRASPGRRYAARPRAASRPPSVPCGRPRRGAAPGSACERAPSGTARKGRATRRSGRGRAGSTEAAPRCGMRRGGGEGRTRGLAAAGCFAPRHAAAVRSRFRRSERPANIGFRP